MPEGRPVWKTVPLRVGLTLAVVVLLALCAVGVVATGAVADRAGQILWIGSTAVLVWDIAKWPVMAVLVSLAFALLYWASPNVKHPGFRWLSPGGVLAVVVWVLASAGFAFYVANFGSYNKTYGSLGGVIGFLVWLWISTSPSCWVRNSMLNWPGANASKPDSQQNRNRSCRPVTPAP
jgi:membrane protein